MAKPPGYDVKILTLIRDTELGEIRVTNYSTPTSQLYRVTAFIPGYALLGPGIPDLEKWCDTLLLAIDTFGRYADTARKQGWSSR